MIFKLFLLSAPAFLAASKSEDYNQISWEEYKATHEESLFWNRVLQSSIGCNKKTLAVSYGTGDGDYCAGDEVSIVSHKCKGGKTFSGWTSVSGEAIISDLSSSEATLTMPDSDAVVEANCASRCELVDLSVYDGSGDGKYCPGDEVPIKSRRCRGRKRFSGWQSIEGNPIIRDALAPSTVLLMPDTDAKVMSLCEKPDCTQYTLVVDNGDGDGEYCAGDEVSIKSKQCRTNEIFSYWETVKGDPALVNTITSSTTLIMPDGNVRVKAVCEESDCTERSLVIVNGSGDGENDGKYCSGSNVRLLAECPLGSTFVQWSIISGGAVIDEKDQSSTVLVMPDRDSTVQATCTATPVSAPSSQPVQKTRRPTRNPGATRRPVRPSQGSRLIPSTQPSKTPSSSR